MSSGATGYSTSLIGVGRRNGTEWTERDDKPDVSVVAMLERVLKSVSVIEHKLEVVEAKIDRLTSLQDDVKSDCSAYAIVTRSEAKQDNLSPSAALLGIKSERGTSDCSAYDVVTGSHDAQRRNEENHSHDQCDSSNDPSLNDRETIGNGSAKPFNHNDNEHVVYSAQVWEYHPDSDNENPFGGVHHSLRVPQDTATKSLKTKQENVKHTSATSNGTHSQPDSPAVNVDIPTVLVNAQPTVDRQGPHSPTHTVDIVTTKHRSLNSLSSSVDDNETDIGTPLRGEMEELVTDNSAGDLSGTFTNQFVHDDLPEGPEEHSVSNSKQPSGTNNQTMSISGFKNDHGNTDNRFLTEAHENIPQTSLRTGNLSNTMWIQSGTWKTDVSNLKHQLRELLEQETRASRDSDCMRSAGLDTVICLDTSSSMTGAPLEKAMLVISQLIDGFEQNAIEHDLEENVAVVVFGKQNKILTHLTNDYNVVRDELFGVTAGGPSPLWLGLALTLTEIKERGNMVTVGESVILPRIILITDGKASPKYVLRGDDTQNTETTDETKQEILTLLETCKKFSRTVDCIQVGPCEQDMLQLLSGGRMFTPDDVDYLTQFFRVQDMAADLTKKFASGEMLSSNVDEVIKQFGLTKKAEDDLKELIQYDQGELSEEDEEDQRTEDMNAQKHVMSNNGNSDELVRPGQTIREDGESLRPGQNTGVSDGVKSISINEVRNESVSTGQTGTENDQSLRSGSFSGCFHELNTGSASTDSDRSSIPVPTDGSIDELRPGEQSIRQGPARRYNRITYAGRGDADVSPDDEEHVETVDVYVDVIDDIRGPLFGTSVEASEKWIGFASRQNLTGTVMGPRKKGGLVKVLWSDGTIDRCRYGVNGQSDFKIVPDMCFGLKVMRIGALIERGPDWRWKDQDGGPGSIGVVTKHDDRVVFVTWSHGGHGNYRYGYNKKYDVKLCESRPKKQAMQAVWQIEDKQGVWHDFEPAATQSIEQMYTYNPDSQFLVQLKSLTLRISIGKLEAMDTKSRMTYAIRRHERTDEHSTTRESL